MLTDFNLKRWYQNIFMNTSFLIFNLKLKIKKSCGLRKGYEFEIKEKVRLAFQVIFLNSMHQSL